MAAPAACMGGDNPSRHHPRKRVIQHPERSVLKPRSHGVLDAPLSRARPPREARLRARSRLLLHVLDARKIDALGTFFGVAEIKFIPGEVHRIAINVVGDRGAVARDYVIEL